MQLLPWTVYINSFFFLILGCLIGRLLLTKVAKKPENLGANPTTQDTLKQKEILEKILEVVKEGVIVTNQAGVIFWTNRKALEILKTSWVLTQNKTIDQIIPKNETADPQSYQVKLTTIDQEEIDVSVIKYPLLNPKLNLQGSIYIINDITDKMALEESKLNFVAIAAHQLRTPLTAIKGYLFILKEKITPKLDTEEKGFLDRTIIGTDRMGFLIENLLNLSKVEKGTLRLNIQPVNLENLIRQTIDGLLTDAKEKNINLMIDKIIKPYPVILGDENLLIEAISNIVANSIKYSKPGGQVSINIGKQSNGISIQVSDKGKGIPANVIPRLFQKFYGATNSLTELSSGLGLGLFISKSIVDAHKGKISINSLENMGTTVTIFLPSNQN